MHHGESGQQSPIFRTALPISPKFLVLAARQIDRAAHHLEDEAPWGGGATPAQALYMVGLLLTPKAAA